MKSALVICCLVSLLSACSRTDDLSPVILLNQDPEEVHYRGDSYIDPGAGAADDYSCNTGLQIQTTNLVDTSLYGSYQVIYTVEDEAGNQAEVIRDVDVILPIDDYYNLTYKATDTCTSNIYIYTGLIQDCNCPSFSVTVGNISNFGLSASFTLPVSGTYNEILTLDTIKASVHFEGFGTMSPSAEIIRWEYSISDSVSTDVCTSTWIKD